VDSVRFSDAGEYRVTASNGSGESSTSVLVAVDRVAILEHPSSVRAVSGGSVEFGVRAVAGDPADLHYQWTRDGLPLAGGTGSVLRLQGVVEAGTYRVQIRSGGAFIESQDAYLTLVDPVRVDAARMRAQSRTLSVGGDLRLTAFATGTPPLRYQWYKNGLPLASEAGVEYVVRNVSVSDSGSYTVQVRNDSAGQEFGVLSSAVEIRVDSPSAERVIRWRVLGSALTPETDGVVVPPDETVELRVEGASLFSEYVWRRNGEILKTTEGAVLRLKMESLGTEGFYEVEAVGSSARWMGAPVRVALSRVPVLDSQPLSQTVVEGGTATFTVGTTGSGQMHYQWVRDGKQIDGGTQSALTIRGVSVADAGLYEVVASSQWGSARSVGAELRVVV
jgi:hypothetical protein